MSVPASEGSGASTEIVVQSVATPIEQAANGVGNMVYRKTPNSSDGHMQLSVTFKVGIDPDMANTLTQNRVAQAQSRLSQEAVQQGVTVKKLNPSFLNPLAEKSCARCAGFFR